MGVLETSKSPKKTHVYASEDNIRRARELTDGLFEILGPHIPDLKLLCAESMSFPMFVSKKTGQHNVMASAATQMGISWGVIICLAEQWHVPLIQASPQRVKEAICGSQKATKDMVQAALDRHFGCLLGEQVLLPKGICKGKFEHPYDALATIIALQDSDVFRAVRGASL